ncbi:MAG: twin-arginine translocase TatA/TatE family subunit [Ignavibacteria bacterium]|jgi:sec-independent protein translocase protein TatA|nr:twin-arginine translocase TatA/TatE family subunit [Ignavibacteria bacterium]
MPTIGMPEILVILLIVVLLFGARKIPELMRGLGSGIREFKKAASVDGTEDDAKKSSSKED